MPSLSRVLIALLISALTLGLAIFAKPAGASLVPTETVVPVSAERERVKELVSRPEVAKKLEQLGVLPKDAASRVDALTEEEVRALAARIDALPAGGLSNQEWLLIIIVILLVVIAL
jgi:hypothetical protein